MPCEVPSLLISEYPNLAGPPVGMFEPTVAFREGLLAMRAHGVTCAGMLAAPDEDDAWAMAVLAWCYPSPYGVLHVLTQLADQSAWLKPREVAALLLKDGTHFLEMTGDQPWVEVWDVALWFQYEADSGLAFLVHDLAERFLPWKDQQRAFRLGQCLFGAIERNHQQEVQAARRAFRKALPALLPGLQIAKKRPGYGWKKGYAHFFLTEQGHLCPTQFWLCPVSQHRITDLRQAMEAYQSPRGYLIAPGLKADAVLDENMVLVPFGRQVRKGS